MRHEDWQKTNAWARCPECTAKEKEARRQRDKEWQQQQAEEQHRRQELETMPYTEYLQTPEWKERRQWALKSAGNRCQVCNTTRGVLHVHHRSYQNRGHEPIKDLIVLCSKCHETFHQDGRMPEGE
jgi:predicted HNH restriction endonuclease